MLPRLRAPCRRAKADFGPPFPGCLQQDRLQSLPTGAKHVKHVKHVTRRSGTLNGAVACASRWSWCERPAIKNRRVLDQSFVQTLHVPICTCGSAASHRQNTCAVCMCCMCLYRERLWCRLPRHSSTCAPNPPSPPHALPPSSLPLATSMDEAFAHTARAAHTRRGRLDLSSADAAHRDGTIQPYPLQRGGLVSPDMSMAWGPVS